MLLRCDFYVVGPVMNSRSSGPNVVNDGSGAAMRASGWVFSAQQLEFFRSLAGALDRFRELSRRAELRLPEGPAPNPEQAMEFVALLMVSREMADPAFPHLQRLAIVMLGSLIPELYGIRDSLSSMRALFRAEAAELGVVYDHVDEVCRLCREKLRWTAFCGLRCPKETIRSFFMHWGRSWFSLPQPPAADLPGALTAFRLRACSLKLETSQLPLADKYPLAYDFLALREEVRALAQGVLCAVVDDGRQAVAELLAGEGFAAGEIEQLLRSSHGSPLPDSANAEMIDFSLFVSWALGAGPREASAASVVYSSQVTLRQFLNDLAFSFLPLVRRQAPRWFPRADPELLEDCVTDAFMLIGRHFNPERGKLQAFLRTRIRGLLANRQRSGARRREHEATLPCEKFKKNLGSGAPKRNRPEYKDVEPSGPDDSAAKRKRVRKRLRSLAGPLFE